MPLWSFWLENSELLWTIEDGEMAQTFWGDILPIPVMELYLGFSCLANELFHVLGTERRVTAEQDICDDTNSRIVRTPQPTYHTYHIPCWPNIDCFAMTSLVQHFRSHISETSGEWMQLFIGWVQMFRTRCTGVGEQKKRQGLIRTHTFRSQQWQCRSRHP